MYYFQISVPMTLGSALSLSTSPTFAEPRLSPGLLHLQNSPGGSGYNAKCHSRSSPVKSGSLYALHTIPGGHHEHVRVRVVLKVYSSSRGRYAVVCQDNAIGRELCCINLKNCAVVAQDVTPMGKGPAFQVHPRNADTQSLSFLVQSSTELAEWLKVLTAEEDKASWSHSGSSTARRVRVTQTARLQPVWEEEMSSL